MKSSVTLVFLGSYLFYVLYHWENLKALLTVDTGSLLLVLAANTAVMLLTGFIFYFMVATLGVRMRPLEWVGLTFVGQIANYLTPLKLGTLSKSVYLKKKYAFSYTNFVVIFAGYNILHLIVISGLGVMTGFMITFFLNGPARILVLALGLFLGLLLLVILTEAALRRGDRVAPSLAPFLDGWRKLRTAPGVLLRLIFFDVLIILLGTLTHVWLFRCIGVTAAFGDMLLLTVLLSLSGVINITPGNIGVGEWIFIFAAQTFGLGLNEAVLATGLGRIIHLLLTFGAAPIFYWELFRRFDHQTGRRPDFHTSLPDMDPGDSK